MINTTLKFLVGTAIIISASLVFQPQTADAEQFTYGGKFKPDSGPLTFFGSKANRKATLSDANRKHLNNPWRRTISGAPKQNLNSIGIIDPHPTKPK